MLRAILPTLLIVVSVAAAGCQTWPGKRAPDEAGVDTNLTTAPPIQKSSSPAVPQEPRPGFEQEPKQTP